MRINAGSKLTANDVYDAARLTRERGHDFHIEECVTSPRGAITFYGESYTGRRRVNRQGNSDAYAATWHAWGWFIAELYNRDPNARIGHYKSASSFMLECRESHDRLVAYEERSGERSRTDVGRDISFLEHLRTANEVSA